MKHIFEGMARRLTLLLVILSLAAGVLAGTPLHAPNDGMMECCRRAIKKQNHSPKAEAARLCCAINCSTPAAPSGAASFNSSPANFTVTPSMADQIAALFAGRRTVTPVATGFTREVLPRTFQPSYIRHHEFLI